MRQLRFAGGLLFALVLANPAPAAPVGIASQRALTALEDAVLASRASLAQRADDGDPVSQLALSLALEHGIDGPVEESEALNWRERAMQTGSGSARRSLPLSKLEVLAARSCAALYVMSVPEDPAAVAQICGPQSSRLEGLWRQVILKAADSQ